MVRLNWYGRIELAIKAISNVEISSAKCYKLVIKNGVVVTIKLSAIRSLFALTLDQINIDRGRGKWISTNGNLA